MSDVAYIHVTLHLSTTKASRGLYSAYAHQHRCCGAFPGAMYQNVQNDLECYVHNEEVRPKGYCSNV